MKFFILIPIYNDWKSVLKLIENINLQLEYNDNKITIFIINDASTEETPIIKDEYKNFLSIKIINIKNNLGHARCIATGLKYVYENFEFDYVIPMDGDGEDRPEEIKNFINLAKQNSNEPIVGKRVKRSEGLIFKINYFIHKIVTLVLTGKSIKFGNFTCLPKNTVYKLINDKTTVILRSILFYAIYLILISNNITLITAIPLALIVIFAITILKVSGRENINSLNNSLFNIDNVVSIK